MIYKRPKGEVFESLGIPILWLHRVGCAMLNPRGTWGPHYET